MFHGPCGKIDATSPCIKEWKCAQNYQKNLIKEIQTEIDGYTELRRHLYCDVRRRSQGYEDKDKTWKFAQRVQN